jgi:sulfopropanediol 3-dehydrogenase
MEKLKEASERKEERAEEVRKRVEEIIMNVRKDGDEALYYYNEHFDGSDRRDIRISSEEISQAYSALSPEEIEDIRRAAANIRAFSEAQKKTLTELKDFSPVEGLSMGHRIIPVNSVCCYVPGGKYPLFSTALMLIIPAKVAGVRRVVACSPSIKGENRIEPETLVAMDIAGADEICMVGGAQAIAAFSYGTDNISPVDMIVGPGNQYVAEAKRQCYGKVGIDFVAGPSEVLIIADGSGRPELAASDLMAQAEHDPMAKSVLFSTDREFALRVMELVEENLKTLSTAGIAASSWKNFGEVILVSDYNEAIYLANEYAPEHLELHVKDPDIYLDKLSNYGSLFIGENTAEVFGDYASGPNHTLPTSKAARYTGGLSVLNFLKVCTYQRMDGKADPGIAGLSSRMARREGLEAHGRAAEIRMDSEGNR